MEIEKEEEYSTCSEYETNSFSLNNKEDSISKQNPENNFTSEINYLKYKTYQEQFISLFEKYNIDKNYINDLVLNFANLVNKNSNKIGISNYLIYSENLIIRIYKIKYYLKENKIEELIKEIKNINENILNKELLFILHRQKLLYLIQNNMISESLDYAKINMIPLTKNNDVLYKELGNSMSLLAYKNINDCSDNGIIKDYKSNVDKVENDVISRIFEFLIKFKS